MLTTLSAAVLVVCFVSAAAQPPGGSSEGERAATTEGPVVRGAFQDYAYFVPIDGARLEVLETGARR